MFTALREFLFGGSPVTSEQGAGGSRGFLRKSKVAARSRLHFVLVQDRTGLSNDDMSHFKSELVSVIEKYFVIDKTGFDITYKRQADTTTLLINSPVIVKRQEGISHQVGSKNKNSNQAKKAQKAGEEKKSEEKGDNKAATMPATKDVVNAGS